MELSGRSLCLESRAGSAAGCVLIAKPPHETPLAIGMVVRCFAEAGLPAGVLNDIPGTGPEVGAALSAHPGIHMITATASVPAGQAIMRAAAGNLKRLSLELGGQCPLLVLDDADPVEAAAAAARRSFSNMGQICIAVNRIIVGKTIHRAFVEALVAETAKIKLGHGVEPGVLYGPVLNDSVRVRTRQHLDDAVARGGKLLIGGTIPTGDAFDKGFFYQPAIVDQVPEGALATTEKPSARSLQCRWPPMTGRRCGLPMRCRSGSRLTCSPAISSAGGLSRNGLRRVLWA